MEITPVGRFDLTQSLLFGFGQREAATGVVDAGSGTATMPLGFVLDGYDEQVGVVVSQQPSGALTLAVSRAGPASLDAARGQVARVLSVDVDATGWDALGERDPLVGALQGARPGLRPPLFYSAYEALVWAVLSARRPRLQMAKVRADLSAAHGATIDVAGQQVAVLPTPRQLLAVKSFPGLTAEKIERLHGVARAALDGRLDTAELRSLPVAEAAVRLRELDGIGPFYAELVIVRALGHTDVLPTAEPQLLAIAGELTGAGRALSPAELDAYGREHWTPWRTWACVAVRAAGPALLEAPPPDTRAPLSRR
ncbi:MAG TPA: DNA-3-methyladenine glycosylase 2 family protein [Actinomycetes bacterium]